MSLKGTDLFFLSQSGKKKILLTSDNTPPGGVTAPPAGDLQFVWVLHQETYIGLEINLQINTKQNFISNYYFVFFSVGTPFKCLFKASLLYVCKNP